MNAKVMKMAGPDAVFMHCLPSFHDLNTTIGKQVGEQYGLDGLEVTNDVFESCLLYTSKAGVSVSSHPRKYTGAAFGRRQDAACQPDDARAVECLRCRAAEVREWA